MVLAKGTDYLNGHSYLAELESVIHHNLEWSHHHLTYQLGLDNRLLQHQRHKLIEMAEDQLRLVVGRRRERGHTKPANIHILVL